MSVLWHVCVLGYNSKGKPGGKVILRDARDPEHPRHDCSEKPHPNRYWVHFLNVFLFLAGPEGSSKKTSENRPDGRVVAAHNENWRQVQLS